MAETSFVGNFNQLDIKQASNSWHSGNPELESNSNTDASDWNVKLGVYLLRVWFRRAQYISS